MKVFSVLRKLTNPNAMGPIKKKLNNAKNTLINMPTNKQWLCGGYRSAAVAAQLLLKGKIIALPTDTIYGLAGLAQNNKSIARLYEIKKRDESKPLAICLCDVNEIENWAHVQDIPAGLIRELLPGPTTLILKRKETLNPHLNPGVENVGIRIPKHDFVRSVVKMVKQPIALTSANESNKRSTLHPSEFESLWPELDGIFFDKVGLGVMKNSWRNGSTIVDLTVKGEFTIIRRGIGLQTTLRILKKSLLTETKKEKNVKNEEENVEESEIPDVMEAHASG